MKKDEINKIWKIKEKNIYSNNLKIFYNLLKKQSRLKQFKIKILGKINSEPIFLLYPKKIIKDNKNILISAGFHGDEPAGSWGLLSFLEKTKLGLFNKINISLLPVINPIGFKRGNERDVSGKEPNIITKTHASREGKILLKHSNLLRKLSSDGFLSLHEDYDTDNFYIYSLERKKRPGEFSKQMINSVSKLYKKFNGIIDDYYKVKEGIIFNEFDDSFENYLFSLGIPRCICSETPREDKINRRIRANRIIISKFVNLVLRER